jgi:hypothetical protein
MTWRVVLHARGQRQGIVPPRPPALPALDRRRLDRRDPRQRGRLRLPPQGRSSTWPPGTTSVKFLCDPYNATKLLIELRDEDGLPVEEIRQGFLSLSAPTKQLERLVKSRKIRNGSNPVLRWMAGNAVADTDAADNVKLSKKKSRLKIDGMAALVNAVAAAGTAEDAESTYNTNKLLLL